MADCTAGLSFHKFQHPFDPQIKSPGLFCGRAANSKKLSRFLLLSVAGKTTDQIIEDIIEHEKVKTGIDWKAAAAAGPTE